MVSMSVMCRNESETVHYLFNECAGMVSNLLHESKRKAYSTYLESNISIFVTWLLDVAADSFPFSPLLALLFQS